MVATFTLSPGADDGVSVIVSEEIKPTRPTNSPRGALFVALDGQLFERDPRQQSMLFEEVDRVTGEVHTTDTRTQNTQPA